ncbi:zinc finger protein VAR3, chloroplastic [Gastrolobium bilobum]|uniref:zinc finger protein VAR3, chloroplastic n=1 Tax=Gastrolobium bilobum TaxID=150636 RepID=UPI002AB0347B|nr:zinc finger protein VAR3, chloroplastic [Gastrolobium bilobum]
MGGAAPRFLFLLTTPLPLLRHHHHHHRKLLFLSPSFSYHFHSLSSSFSSSTSSLPSPLKLKLKASQHQQQQQQQHIHTQSPSSLRTEPWPEWSTFLSHISSTGYVATAPDDAFAAGAAVELSQLVLRQATACLAFARDRPNLLRLLSMRDIAVVVEHGSPFLFREAEDSVRRMKSFVSNIDASVLDTDRANMVDLMKFMLSYAINPLVSSERNSLNNRDLVESSVRNLFGELFKLSYNAPGPNSSSMQSQMPGRFGQKMPPRQNIEMKRGDWICPRCNFMNFARNVKCLECEEARPKRQLAGGEWECPQCDFHNYGRNMTCLRCDCKRPGQISLDATNTMSHTGYGNTDNSNTSDVEARLAANEEKAQRWFSKVSQLDSSADINSVIADEDFPEIMPLRKGVNRFVVSTRKTPLERRLANAEYKRNLGNNGVPGVEDFIAGESTKPRDTLDDILGHSASFPQSDDKNIVVEQNISSDSRPSGSNYSTVPPVQLSADMLAQKSENLLAEESKEVVLNTDVEHTSPGYSSQLSNNSTSQNVIRDEDKEQAEKSERWFRKVAELNGVGDLTSAISDEDFPEIMPMRKGENRFVVSKKKDRSLTTPAYKRRMAMEQSGNTNFVPFVPFPPDYFAKNDKQQADSADRSNVESSIVSEVVPDKPPEMSDDARAGPGLSPKPSEQSSNNIHVGSIYETTTSGNSSQSFNQEDSGRNRKEDHVPNSTGSSSLTENSSPTSENQSVRAQWTGKSLEGSAVREPDPLDMSEEAKAERWFRRAAQIKDISELSQIPDEDFPSIMPMRKGVNRFVVSKRKTPLERRLTSQQYRRNLPIVSSDPVKKENEGS